MLLKISVTNAFRREVPLGHRYLAARNALHKLQSPMPFGVKSRWDAPA